MMHGRSCSRIRNFLDIISPGKHGINSVFLGFCYNELVCESSDAYRKYEEYRL